MSGYSMNAVDAPAPTPRGSKLPSASTPVGIPEMVEVANKELAILDEAMQRLESRMDPFVLPDQIARMDPDQDVSAGSPVGNGVHRIIHQIINLRVRIAMLSDRINI